MYNYVCIYNIGCSGDPESHWIPGTEIHTYIAILINSPDGWRFFSCTFTFCKMKTNPPTDYIKIINVQVHLWELIAVHFLQVLIILYTCTCTTCISVKGLDLSLWITDWSYKRLHGLRPELCVTCTLITVNHFELQMYLLNLLCWQSQSLPSWFN